MKQLIFWQNIPSIHQSALIRNLANCEDYKVTLVSGADIGTNRLSMGWQMPDFGNADVIIKPRPQDMHDLIHCETEAKVHIFSGIRGHPMVRNALKQSLNTRATIGVFAEIPNNPYGMAGALRRLLYTAHALRYRRRIDFILAIGDNGVNWYKMCGYPIEKIYPFAYFVEAQALKKRIQSTDEKENTCIKIIFIGGLIECKGVDLLLQAAELLPKNGFEIQIIGDGSQRQELLEIRDKLKLGRRVKFHGSMKNSDAMRCLEISDLLVLPSRYDGWGAVVSEAIMRGIPALCSDRCGAAAILDGVERGEVFTACSVGALAQTLEKWIKKGPLQSDRKEKIKKWAAKSISGEVAANYLHNILLHVEGKALRPKAPWS